MNQWTEGPIRLSCTTQGEIVLYADCELWYSFRFGTIFRYLTADEFHRLHCSVMTFDWRRLPIHASQSAKRDRIQSEAIVTLFGTLTRSDMLELRSLLCRAALLVMAISRISNDLN